jgi:hypothetical protein
MFSCSSVAIKHGITGLDCLRIRMPHERYSTLIVLRTIDESDARMGFARLSARGRALFGDVVAQPTK